MGDSYVRGYCKKHYAKFIKYGDPTVVKNIGRKEFVCPSCGKIFNEQFSKTKDYKVLKCKECRRSIRKTKGKKEYKCLECGKLFIQSIIREEDGRNKFCSSKCYYKSKVGSFSAEKNPLWKGGVSNLTQYFRGLLKDWKKEQLKNKNYKCELTGNGGELIIHHRFSFHKIVEITLKELSLSNLKIKYYSTEKMKLVTDKFLLLHEKLSSPIVLSKGIHNLYHQIYGFDNTPEQFEEFKARYLKGEFNEQTAKNRNYHKWKVERN
jgi:DNA-directed RNA polymerase subunit RPC12/RpoP